MKHLAGNWKTLVRRAWSIRLMVIAGLLSGAEVALPMFSDAIPRGLFAILSSFAVGGAFIARLVVQKEME